MLVGKRMRRDVITVGPEEGIWTAMKLIREERIRHLPVVEGRRLVGIITETDILEAFVEVMGLGLSRARLELVVEDRPGVFPQVCRVIEEFDGNISSIVTARATHRGKERKVLIVRLEVGDIHGVVKQLERNGFPVLSVSV